VIDRFYKRLTAENLRFPILGLIASLIVTFSLGACGVSPQVLAEQRMFLPLSVEFLGEYQLPQADYQGTRVGGLSAITYDRANNRFYLLSDDRSQKAPARFYRASLQINGEKIEKVNLEAVTFLKDGKGETFKKGSIDPEGIAFSPRQTLFISSEGAVKEGIAPFVAEFDLQGQLKESLLIPNRFLPDDSNQKGIQDNLGLNP